MDLQELSDRAEILDCMHRYARGMDRHDRELVRSAYHPDAIDDHLAYCGPVDGFIEFAFGVNDSYVRHQHYITNHSVEIDGDEAHAETYFMFVGTSLTPGDPLTVFGGRYADRLERRDGQWGIVARRCLVEWSSNLDSTLPVEGLGIGGTIAQDRTDTTYQRPLVIP